jgi:hypothetical protein
MLLRYTSVCKPDEGVGEEASIDPNFDLYFAGMFGTKYLNGQNRSARIINNSEADPGCAQRVGSGVDCVLRCLVRAVWWSDGNSG